MPAKASILIIFLGLFTKLISVIEINLSRAKTNKYTFHSWLFITRLLNSQVTEEILRKIKILLLLLTWNFETPTKIQLTRIITINIVKFFMSIISKIIIGIIFCKDINNHSTYQDIEKAILHTQNCIGVPPSFINKIITIDQFISIMY